MRDNEKIIDVENAEITRDYFSIDGHKYIFMAITYLFSKQIKPTPLAIMETFNSDDARKKVEELGGLEYLTILEDMNIDVNTYKFFIEKLKQSYTRKSLYKIAEDMKGFVLSEKSESLNPSELLSFVDKKISDLSVNSNGSVEVYKMGDDTDEVLLHRAETPNQVPGLEVGWETFDKKTNGGQPGDLIVVCAESKTGKSVTLTNWATNLSINDDIPVLYIDTEMNQREQEDRVLANLTGIPHSEIVSGLYALDTANGKASDKMAKLKIAREKLKLGNYYHIFMPHFTIEKVGAIAKKFVNQYGIKAIFFDYIKIPSSQANFKSVQEYQALGYFTSGLKELAGTLKIPVYTACQTNRGEIGSENPNASNIGGSYRILQLATKLIFLVNKSDERIAKEGIDRGNQQLIIKYQRNGESDCEPINIMFYKHITRQVEV